MGDPCAATIIKDSDAVALEKTLVWICLLSDRQRATSAVETDFHFDALAAADFPPDMRSSSGTEPRTANGRQGAASSFANLMTEDAASHSSKDHPAS